jgi:hypothetical protein
MKEFQLCFNDKHNYVYCEDRTGNKKINVEETPFYKYIFVSSIEDIDGKIADGFQVRSHVIWYVRGYHEFYIDTFFTDWKTF